MAGISASPTSACFSLPLCLVSFLLLHQSLFLIPLSLGAVLGFAIIVACVVLLRMRRTTSAATFQTSQPTADGSLSITLGDGRSKNSARIIMPPGKPAYVTYQPETVSATFLCSVFSPVIPLQDR